MCLIQVSVLLDANIFQHFILLHKTTTPEFSNISQEINAELSYAKLDGHKVPFLCYSLRGHGHILARPAIVATYRLPAYG